MLKLIRCWFSRRIMRSVLDACNKQDILEAFLHAAEINYVLFKSYIFVQKKTEEKLTRLGFVDVFEKFPHWINDDITKVADKVLYQPAFNLVVCVTNEERWEALNITIEIVKEVRGSYLHDYKLFHVTMHTLLSNKTKVPLLKNVA